MNMLFRCHLERPLALNTERDGNPVAGDVIIILGSAQSSTKTTLVAKTIIIQVCAAPLKMQHLLTAGGKRGWSFVINCAAPITKTTKRHRGLNTHRYSWIIFSSFLLSFPCSLFFALVAWEQNKLQQWSQ